MRGHGQDDLNNPIQSNESRVQVVLFARILGLLTITFPNKLVDFKFQLNRRLNLILIKPIFIKATIKSINSISRKLVKVEDEFGR